MNPLEYEQIIMELAEKWTPPPVDAPVLQEKEEEELIPVDEEVLTPENGARRLVDVSNAGVMDKESERLYRMCQVASKFASTLTLRHIHTDISDDNYGDAPAWSDSENIWFQRRMVGDLTDPEVVTALKGLTLHELSHIMLTPRNGSSLSKWVQKSNLWRAFNALEDMRIEMYMTTKFTSTDDWLKATIAQHLLNKPEQISVAYPLLHGRKYLPFELRKVVRDAYEDQASVVELGELIDKYIVLNLSDPADVNKAMPIIERYNELVNGLPPANPEYYHSPKGWQKIDDPNGHSHRKENEWKSSSTSKPASKGEQGSVMGRVDVKSGEDFGDLRTEDPNGVTESGDETGVGFGIGSGNTGKAFDIAKDMLNNVIKNKAVEIATSIKQFTGEIELSGKAMKAPARPEWCSERDVPSDVVQSSKSFGAELMRLKADFDPGWARRTEQGKLNVQRYVTGCDVEEAFDTWDAGREDAVDIECVILLDNSGSMGSSINEAYQSMWAIKRALDKINASTTVVTYGSKTQLLYSADERASLRTKYAGLTNSTEPLNALRYARSVLGNSKRAVKLVITITDGWWDDATACNSILSHMRKAGVLTALAYIEKSWSTENDPNYIPKVDAHGCEVAVHITESRDLFQLAKRMVKAGITRNIGS
jgi:hypothetical protein